MKKQPQHAVLSGLSIVLMLLAVVTVLPYSGSHPNLLGYRSVCGFVPLSTLILLGAALFARLFRDMNYKAAPRHPSPDPKSEAERPR